MKRILIPFIFTILALPQAWSSDIPGASIEAVLQTTYENLIESQEIFTYELVDRRIRIPKRCFRECQCLVERFHQALQENKSQLEFFEVQLISLRLGPNSTAVKMHKPTYTQFFNYHNVLLIKKPDGLWVVDPILTSNTNLLLYDEWITYFSGFRELRLEF